MYRSYSVSNMPTPIPYEPKRETPRRDVCEPEKNVKKRADLSVKNAKKGGFFDEIKADDIILIIVVLALLLDDCDDKLLVAALGFVFISDFF